jgi:hypothetical protein
LKAHGNRHAPPGPFRTVCLFTNKNPHLSSDGKKPPRTRRISDRPMSKIPPLFFSIDRYIINLRGFPKTRRVTVFGKATLDLKEKRAFDRFFESLSQN